MNQSPSKPLSSLHCKSNLLTQWDFCVGSWSLVKFYWLFCIQYEQFRSTCCACLEVVFEFEWRATYFSSLRARYILAPQVCHNELIYNVLYSNLHTTSKHGPKTCQTWKVSFANNQLPTKSYVELQDSYALAICTVDIQSTVKISWFSRKELLDLCAILFRDVEEMMRNASCFIILFLVISHIFLKRHVVKLPMCTLESS